jgi:hypothetical protein
VTKISPIVTYGSKVAGIVPGNFSEIYHFNKTNAWDSTSGKSSTKYSFTCDAMGDDFAKSNIGLKGEYDFTDKLFYTTWKEQVAIHMKEVTKDRTEQIATAVVNPFNETEQPTNKWKT